MARKIRKTLALFVCAPLFVFLAWTFGVFFQPQGGLGAGTALILILVSAVVSIWIYAWLAGPGPLARFSDRGVDGHDRDWGVGMIGAGQTGARRRRNDEPEDLGGRRSSGDIDDDGAGTADYDGTGL